MKVEVDEIFTSKGRAALITLTNASGASVTLSSLGSGIVAVNVPDRYGVLSNVVTNYLPGSDAVIWNHEIINDDEVMFCIPSCTLSYRWTEDNVLEIYYHPSSFVTGVTTQKDGFAESGFVDVLGQTYFNLDDNPGALPYEYLWLNSSDHPDFSTATQLRTHLSECEMFSHIYHLRDWVADVMNDAVMLASHGSRLRLSIHTSFPTIRIAIPNSHRGISFSTNDLSLLQSSSQTTFLHFSPLN